MSPKEMEKLNIDEPKIMPCNRRNFNMKYIFHISFGFTSLLILMALTFILIKLSAYNEWIISNNERIKSFEPKLENYTIGYTPEKQINPELWSINQIQQQLAYIIKNPVPIGFIYVQLPRQPEPKTLWSMVEWEDVTSDYAGLFFRAEGQNSAKFGETQYESSPRLVNVFRHDEWAFYESKNNDFNYAITPGMKSGQVYTGDRGDTHHPRSISFLVSSVEVRPRNQAIRIWKRTN